MKKIEYDFGRPVPCIETPVAISGPCGMKIVNACWDTGATHTTILESLAKELGLTPVGEVYGTSVGVSMSYRRYAAKLNLGNGIIFEGEILGTESISKDMRIGLLIGMDLISMGDMCVLSLKGKTKFSFEVG